MSAHDSHAPTRDELARLITARPISSSLKLACIVLAALGFAAFLVGAAMGNARAWQAFLVNWIFFTLLSSAGVMFAAVQRITTARWSRPVTRFAEGMVSWLPIAWILLALMLFVGRGHIYSWAMVPPTAPEKRLWLDPSFLIPRDLIIFGIIVGLSWFFVRNSVRLDVGILPEWGASWARGIREGMRRGFGDERRELHSTHSVQGKIAVFLALAFGIGWVVLAWDLSMSVDYHFQSTMYGWQIFMGGWLLMLMVLAILLRIWRRFLDADHLITEHHYHDVGKLCFAFTAFWGYLTFSQLLVIWYGNMGEETHFFRLRLIQPWTSITVTVAIFAFAIPFFSLLSKRAKTFSPAQIVIASFCIVGLWLHRYLEIYPAIYPQTKDVPIGVWEIAVTLGFLGLWGWLYAAFMDAFPRMRVFLMTSPFRDEVQVPVDPKTMEPLPAHE